ncbi:MAG: hypothetical protein IPP77_11170 [Bacteroidetes bacterium]|nr:hypothetical protein [Bacteroidota bacterium]
MASNTETGHALNISNFKLIYDKCLGLGGTYNPSNPIISLPSLFAQWGAADGQQNNLNGALSNAKPLINARRLAFEPLDILITRTLNALKASNVDKEIIADAKGLADKIRGHKVEHPQPENPENPENPNPEWVSNSHLSFVQRVNNFRQYIDLLLATPNYIPNESDLMTSSLNTLYTTLKTMNDDFGTNVVVPVETVRNSRNHLLYDHETGVVDVSLKVKDYIKSIFGATANETHQFTSIKLTRIGKNNQ